MVLSGLPPIYRETEDNYCEFSVCSALGFLQAVTCSSVEPFEKVVKYGFFTQELPFN